MTTTAVDLLVVAYRALAPDEQDAAFAQLRELRVQEAAGEESDAARFVRSLQTVASYVGHPDAVAMTVDVYKQASRELAESGEDIETFSRLYRHYGNWPRALEALDLSATTTPRRIEARFRYRRVGKVWRFSEQALREALLKCARYYTQLEGRDEPRGVSVAEFDHWRQRELELAQARGDVDFFLPSAGPYRSRYKTWEGALLHFGFTPEQAAARLQPRIDPAASAADPYLPDGLPVAELNAVVDTGPALALTVEQALRVRVAYADLARRSRYVLTVRLGLSMNPWPLRRAAEPLGLHLSRIRQIQLAAIDALADAAAGPGRARPQPQELRDAVVGTLRLLAAPPVVP